MIITIGDTQEIEDLMKHLRAEFEVEEFRYTSVFLAHKGSKK